VAAGRSQLSCSAREPGLVPRYENDRCARLAKRECDAAADAGAAAGHDRDAFAEREELLEITAGVHQVILPR
jgi:hypothetical protein